MGNTTPLYVGTVIHQYKDPYETNQDSMEVRGFFGGSPGGQEWTPFLPQKDGVFYGMNRK